MDATEQRLPNQPSEFARLVFFEPVRAAEKLAPLLTSGETAPQIGARFGVNESTVRRWVYRLRESGHLAVGFQLGPRVKKRAGPTKAKIAKGIVGGRLRDSVLANAARDYGSQAKAAAALGVSRQHVNAAIRRLSEKK